MEPRIDDFALVRAHERKVRQAADVLEEAQRNVLAAVTRDSSEALAREARQARRHADQLVGEAVSLVGVAERLMAEAKALQGEYTSGLRLPPSQT